MRTKRLRLRISKFIPSFQSCRSKDPSTLPANPVPSFSRLSAAKHKILTAGTHSAARLPRFHHSSLIKHNASSSIFYGGCGRRSKSTLDHIFGSKTEQYKWLKEDRFHVVDKVYVETPRRKIYNSSVSERFEKGGALPPRKKRAEKMKTKKMISRSTLRMSSSSAESGLFSSEAIDERDEGEEEIDTLVSSPRSWSSDSSCEYSPHLETIRETPRRKKKMSNNKAKKVKSAKDLGYSIRKNFRLPAEGDESPARLSVFQRLIPCTVDGKVRESVAVVKKSENPYDDFKRSMVEMIVEKEMFDEKDLEQLLHCFLSLNSRQYHGTIVEAFCEIWDGLFCKIRDDRRRRS